jgi:hypothetical protein
MSCRIVFEGRHVSGVVLYDEAGAPAARIPVPASGKLVIDLSAPGRFVRLPGGPQTDGPDELPLVEGVPQAGGGFITRGARVVCIDGRFPPEVLEWGSQLPREGTVYTVAQVTRAPHGVTGVVSDALVLEELDNPLPNNGGQLCFNAERFRLAACKPEESPEQGREGAP